MNIILEPLILRISVWINNRSSYLAGAIYLIEKFQTYTEHFIILEEEAHEKIGPHAFSIIVRDTAKFSKDEFVAFLDEKGVDSRNLFYSIPTQCPSYEFLGHQSGDFAQAEYCSQNGTHIGIHQDIELEDLDYVADVTKEFLNQKG